VGKRWGYDQGGETQKREGGKGLVASPGETPPSSSTEVGCALLSMRKGKRGGEKDEDQKDFWKKGPWERQVSLPSKGEDFFRIRRYLYDFTLPREERGDRYWRTQGTDWGKGKEVTPLDPEEKRFRGWWECFRSL